MPLWKSARPRWFHVWAAPVLLVAVAVGQQGLAHGLHLTPWKGGGFGMFSTVDNPHNRAVRVAIGRGDAEVPLPLPEGTRMDALVRAAKPFPTDARLRPVAEEVGLWRGVAAAALRQAALAPPADTGAYADRPPASPLADPPLADTTAAPTVPPEWLEGPAWVRVEVWGMRFDPGTRTLRARLLHAYRHALS